MFQRSARSPLRATSTSTRCIYFNPFAFDVDLGGSLSVLVDGDVKAGLGFDLRLRGPNTFRIDGKVWVTVMGFDVEFPIRHTWGTPQTLPPATADPVALLMGALHDSDGFEAVAATYLSSGVTFIAVGRDERTPADPAGRLRLVQKAVPLGVTIAKVGEARLAGDLDRFDLAVLDAGATARVAPAQLEFVRGHYWELTEAQRLRTPVFERHQAGIEITSDGLEFDATAAIEEAFAYEVIVIGAVDQPANVERIVQGPALPASFVARWAEQGVRRGAAPLRRRADRAADAVSLRSVGYIQTAADEAIVLDAMPPRDEAAGLVGPRPRPAPTTSSQPDRPTDDLAVRVPSRRPDSAGHGGRCPTGRVAAQAGRARGRDSGRRRTGPGHGSHPTGQRGLRRRRHRRRGPPHDLPCRTEPGG